MSTRDTLATVVAFYTRELPARGWTVVELQTKPDETKWKLSRAGAEAKVEVERKPELPVDIKVERDDR
jgi:hypothetical protein